MANATAQQPTRRAHGQGFAGISVQSTQIDTTPIEGTAQVLGYLQLTGHGRLEVLENKTVTMADSAHAHGAIDQSNVQRLGLKPGKDGVAKFLIKAFPNRGTSVEDCDYSLTFAVMDAGTNYDGPTVKAVPGAPDQLTKLGRLGYIDDERALLRGAPDGRSPLANFDQLEVRPVDILVFDPETGEPVMDEETGKQATQGWLQLVGITA